jgi:putative Mg2+ transporter-C (MgtC) family protein
MACGAGLPVLALAATAGHFVVVLCFPHIVLRFTMSRWTPSMLQLSYEDGREILRDVLVVCTQHDFAVSRLRVQRASTPAELPDAADLSDLAGRMDEDPSLPRADEPQKTYDSGVKRQIATVVMEVQGTRSVSKLAARLADIPGLVSVNAGDGNVPAD